MTKKGTLSELLAELKPEVVFLAEHLFRANWQHQQFELMRTATPFPRIQWEWFSTLWYQSGFVLGFVLGLDLNSR